MLFAELARRIVSPEGRVGLLLPSGIATDHTTKEFFGELVASKTLSAVYDFVNRLGLFPDVEGRLKFCVLLFSGAEMPVGRHGLRLLGGTRRTHRGEVARTSFCPQKRSSS